MNASMKERLTQIMDAVTWHITEQRPDGSVIIEARDGGKPVYRFYGQYLPQTGEWKLHGNYMIDMDYGPLCYVSRISVYDVHREGCVPPPD